MERDKLSAPEMPKALAQYYKQVKEEGKGRRISYTHNFSNLKRQITVSPEWKQMTTDFTDIDAIKGHLSSAGGMGEIAQHVGHHTVGWKCWCWECTDSNKVLARLAQANRADCAVAVKSVSVPVVPTNFQPHDCGYGISVLLPFSLLENTPYRHGNPDNWNISLAIINSDSWLRGNYLWCTPCRIRTMKGKHKKKAHDSKKKKKDSKFKINLLESSC